MATSIPRWLLPRGGALVHSYSSISPSLPSRASRCHILWRHASNNSPSPKPRVLEKPSKFNPPSHPARLNRAPPRQYPGPPLSAPEVEAQKTRPYPHMMPPEGSFMRWFLTNRTIHMWITLSTLFSLALFTIILDFNYTSPFAHLIPSASVFYSHPINFISTCFKVYKMHTEHISAETAERRRKKIEDVQKRALYRKAHGLDKEQGLGGWTAKADDTSIQLKEAGEQAAINSQGAQELGYVDFEGKRRPVKKWLGIW